MIGLGIDIGTTTVCGIAMDKESREVLEAITLANDSSLLSAFDWEKTQDVSKILQLCLEIVGTFREKYEDIKTIGISGQMHGILYVDNQGEAVSPLYTWQDGRGNLEYTPGITYSEFLTRETGYPMASGFGLTTHFYNQVNRCVPKTAVSICTIGDYIAMKLSGKKEVTMHRSMAASMGLFDLKRGIFDIEALHKAEIKSSILPPISMDEKCISHKEAETQIALALGDNQASFLGSVNKDSNLLVNIGTGSQISIFAESCEDAGDIEYRPYINGTYLMVGSPLCGGASYALLKDFFKQTLELFGCEAPADIYSIMNQAADAAYGNTSRIIVNTKFKGTRKNPSERGSIESVGTDNFTPEGLLIGMLRGISHELLEVYEKVPSEYKQSRVIIGSGNGIRKNKVLQRVIEDTFGKSLEIPKYKEEASCGAALYAMYTAGYISLLQ